MLNRDVEQKLKNAVGHLAPDVLPGILSACDERQTTVVYLKHPPKRRWVHRAGTIAAALVVLLGGFFVSSRISNNRVDALVMLDVNPSIELKVNQADRVLSVAAKNDDAIKILDHMDLKNTPIDVAINALIGSMLKYGYIQESANSVLLSVESADGEKREILQRTLTQSISQQLNLINGAVISQNLTSDDTMQTLAESHQISYGKAALIQKILDENSHLLFADLAKLSVNELNLLVGSKGIAAEGMEARGSASDGVYIGEEKAKQAALAHAGINESETARLHIELDYDDGGMVYEVEFDHQNREYEYEINAKDGAVIEYDQKSRGGSRREPENNPPVSQGREDFIGESRALEIAQTHARIQGYTGLKVGLDKDDGLYIYEVEFDAENKEYDYEIDAVTGDILSWEAEDGKD